MSKDTVKLVEINSSIKEIEKISAMAAKTLEKERNIIVSYGMAIPTIVYEFLNTVAHYLAENKGENDVEVNIMDILTMGVSYRASEDGENEGNFTPYAVPGPTFKKTVKDNNVTEED